MNTSKRTQEPKWYMYKVNLWSIEPQSCSTNREAANGNNRKPHNLERTLGTFFVVLTEATSDLHVIVSVTSVANF